MVESTTRIGDADKKNPNSLRQTLKYIRYLAVGKRHSVRDEQTAKVSEFVKFTNKFGGRYVKSSEKTSQTKKRCYLNSKSVANIERDATHVSYWQLEIYANSAGIPTGVLLLFSRILSELEKRPERLPSFVEKLQKIVDDLKVNVKDASDMDVDRLRSWSQYFGDDEELLI